MTRVVCGSCELDYFIIPKAKAAPSPGVGFVLPEKAAGMRGGDEKRRPELSVLYHVAYVIKIWNDGLLERSRAKRNLGWVLHPRSHPPSTHTPGRVSF